MLAVAIEPGPALRVGAPRVLFEGDYRQETDNQGAHQYDVSADGRRFLMMAPAPQEKRENPPPQIVVVQNFHEELKRLVPVN